MRRNESSGEEHRRGHKTKTEGKNVRTFNISNLQGRCPNLNLHLDEVDTSTHP